MTEQAPRDIHDLMNQGTVAKPEKLLSQDDKASLADAGTPFVVTDIAMGDDNEYGPYWEVKAQLPDGPVSFRLSQHDRRDTFMSSLAGVVAGGPISGLRLVSYPARGGNLFVTLEAS